MKNLYSSRIGNQRSLFTGFQSGFGVRQLFIMISLLLISSGAWGANTWYTLASGKWTNPQIWTLDPAGAVPVNPSGLYPDLATDNIVIRTGITVTIPDGLTPYDSPLETKNNINCGTLTVNGDLDFGVSTGHQFTQIKGNGRVYFESNNFPTSDWTNFTTSGLGGGTIVLKGSSFAFTAMPSTVYNLEINNSVSTNIYTLDQNLAITGNLTLESGVLQINGTSTTVRNLTVNGNVNVKASGKLTTGTASGKVFHWMNVSGNFTNSGVVDLSNSVQYSEATNGAVKLKFLGATDNNFIANGTTDLYRLFVDKGSDQTYSIAVSTNSASNFKLFGPVSGATNDATDGSFGWQRLPIVLTNGTLKLESNISIPRLGENISGTMPTIFTIPSSAQLVINGASVTTSSIAGSWNGITIFGKLKVEGGSFTTTAGTNGIYYATDGIVTPELEITGGDVYATQIRDYNSSAKFLYNQSGGTIHFNARGNDHWSNSVFYLPATTHVFEMSGGTIDFTIANTHNVTGIYINSSDGNYNVTGGTVVVNTPSTNDFKICSTVPFYNLTVNGTGSAYVVKQTELYGGVDPFFYGALSVLNDFTISSSGAYNSQVFNLSVGGNMTINSGSSFAQTAGTSAKLTFNGAKNSILTNQNATALTLGDLEIDKDIFSPSTSFYTLSLAGSTGGITINDSLRIIRGKFDVANYNINLKKSLEITDGDLTSSGAGSIILSGTALQTIKGSSETEQNFGRLQLNNTAGVKLLSDINATSVLFNANVLFDLDIYNLDISIANYTSGSWGTSRMFKTSGKVSDGGLTLPIVLSSNYGADPGTNVQVFPFGSYNAQGGSTLQYNPAFIDAKGTLSNSGKITIKPVNTNHPTVTDASKVIPYYWKVSYTGLSGISPNDMRYRFTYAGTVPPSVNKGVILNGFAWNEFNSAVSGQTVTFPYTSSYLTVDYSIGNKSAFNAPRVLYSKASGAFNGANTWTLSSTHSGASVAAPNAYDFCIIGGAAGINHTVTITASNADASQVYIKGSSETGISGTPPTLYVNSGTSGNDIDIISGNGRLVYENNLGYWSDFTLINGNHADFCNNATAIVEYTGSGSGPRIIPVTTNIPYYPNLTISGSAGTTQTTNSMNLVVKGNLDIESSTFFLDGNYAEYVKVSNNVIINSGTLTYEPTGIRYMNVDGDLIFTGSGTFNATTGGAENILTLKGNIQQANGTINFGTGGRLLTLALVGTANSLHTSNIKIADFYRVTVNKSSGAKAQFSSDFNLFGATNGVAKALTITSGECHLNNSNISIDLSTGGSAFKIPTGTTLRVDNGSRVNVGGSASNTGFWLDGALIVDNAGKVYCNQGSGGFTDNYIEYTPSGTASIWLGTNAELLVGSQLRRTTTSGAGVLQFTQAKSSSVVTLGMSAAPTSNRGVFEIVNGGSSFTQTESGSNITIVRAQTAASAPTLLFNPETVSIASGAGFTLGNGSTPASTNMGIYSTAELKNLTIGTTNNPTVTIKTEELVIGENLVNGGTFNTAGYALTLKGNFTNTGTYQPAGNTTYISGASDQTINGVSAVSFYNFIKNSTSVLNLTGNSVVVTNDLSIGTEMPLIMGGTINTGNYNLSVGRNLLINGTTLSTGASSGLICNGSALQELSGAATFARLTINNTNGLNIPTQEPSINFTESLNLQNGVFNIGNNLVTFDNDAVITAPGGFSSTRMIQTNLSFTDNGIRKTLPVVNGAPFSFTFPIGAAGKYTPIDLSVAANANNTGSIRVKAANERHVSITNDPLTPIDETQNVLQYNWTMDATGIIGFTGNAVMNFIDTDALVTTPNDTVQYITARILLSSTNWNKFDVNSFNGGAPSNLKFQFANTDDSGIDGDYTAGITNCIPDVVPTFISVANASWSSATTWATYNPATLVTGTAGVGVPAGGPRGSVVYINSNVSMTDNFMAAYRTYINANGVLSTEATFGHRLGDVNGKGVLQMQSGSLPAGVYDNFFSTNGGTLEYTGTALNYSILSEVTSLNNLLLSGTGERNFPNIGFTILGNFTIVGGDCKNPHNTNFDIKGNVIFTGGTFDANTATVTLDGTALQTISGTSNFVAPNEFYDLAVNNSAGVNLLNSVEVANVLTLTNGVVNTETSGTLTLTNSLPSAFAGGGPSAYVEGVLRKQINNSSYFNFPVGDNSRYGGLLKVSPNGTSQGIWSVRYMNGSPASAGFTTNQSPIVYVSGSEYWNVQAPNTSALATLQLPWDGNSGINPIETGNRVVYYAESPLGWTEKAATFTGNTTTGTALTTSTIPFSGFSGLSRVTFGATTIPAYTWDGSAGTDWFTPANWSNDIVPSASANTTIANTTNKPIISGSTVAQTNNLTLLSGATLTLDPGSKMTINGNLAIADANSFIVKNLPASMASLMTNGSIAGTARIENTIPLAVRYWYYGFSVNGAGVTSGVWNATDATNTFAYKYESNAYVRFTNNTTALSANPLGGYLNGYSVKRLSGSASGLITTQGTLNNGDLTTTLPASSFNLMCNPYPSSLDMSVVYSNNINNYGTSKIYPTIWVPTNATGSTVQSTYNLATGIGTNGGSKILAPTQGYWIRNNNTTTQSFSVNQAARLHTTTALKSLQANTEEDIFRMEMVSPAMTDEMVVGFRKIGSLEVTYYDSEKRFNSGNTSCSIYAIKGGKSLAINLLPIIDTLTVVPVGYFAGATGGGEVILRATNLNSFDSNIEVWLEDKATGQTVNLREVGDVIVSIASGYSIDRFSLLFKRAAINAPTKTAPAYTGTATALTPSVSDVKSNITITQINNQVVVTFNTDNSIDAKIEIITLDGKIVSKTNTKYKETKITIPSKQQVYVVNVVNGLDIKTAKVVSQGNR